ncbi:putative tyramine receptor 2 [Orchesella cincta]|uniref:Putative tyramine receptor 2 n=1 Tax=Orchesella cincta TaxID=48709 RepID=A0A1D2NGL4_ORCCI|nr:putative tyramine receptor 2 [Orchesella cincta]
MILGCWSQFSFGSPFEAEFVYEIQQILFGWEEKCNIMFEKLFEMNDCNILFHCVLISQLSREIGYVLYSALGSFYIPSCIMVFVYIRIYFAARARARRAVRKPPKPKPAAAPIEIEEKSKGVGSVVGGSVTEGSATKATTSTTAAACLIPQANASRESGTNKCLSGESSLPQTPDGRTSKQVGFQEPLTGKNEVIVKPEITVESCSPELNASGEKDQKQQQPTTQQQQQIRSCCKNDDEESTNNAQERQVTSEVYERTIVESKSETDKDVMTSDQVAVIDDSEGTEPKSPEGGGGRSSEPESRGSSTKLTTSSESTVEGNRDQETQDSPKVGCSKDSPTRRTRASITGGELRRASDNVDKPNSQQPLVPTVHLKQSMEDECSSASNRLPHQQSTLAVSELESKMSELQSNGSSRPDEGSTSHSSTKKSKGSKLHFLRVETPTIWRTSSSLSLNGDVHILGTLSRSCSRLQLDMDPVSDVEPSSSDSGAVSRCAVVKPLKLRLCQPFFGKKSASNKARRDVLDMGKLPSPKEVRDPEREKRRIARKKEKRATLILGLIMGSFILCWLPFFFLYILEPLCPSCHVAPWGFAIAFWLGYMNSALNPVIYTIFNKDFRRAFRRILFK